MADLIRIPPLLLQKSDPGAHWVTKLTHLKAVRLIKKGLEPLLKLQNKASVFLHLCVVCQIFHHPQKVSTAAGICLHHQGLSCRRLKSPCFVALWRAKCWHHHGNAQLRDVTIRISWTVGAYSSCQCCHLFLHYNDFKLVGCIFWAVRLHHMGLLTPS